MYARTPPSVSPRRPARARPDTPFAAPMPTALLPGERILIPPARDGSSQVSTVSATAANVPGTAAIPRAQPSLRASCHPSYPTVTQSQPPSPVPTRHPERSEGSPRRSRCPQGRRPARTTARGKQDGEHRETGHRLRRALRRRSMARPTACCTGIDPGCDWAGARPARTGGSRALPLQHGTNHPANGCRRQHLPSEPTRPLTPCVVGRGV
jgi:hypothetical protein